MEQVLEEVSHPSHYHLNLTIGLETLLRYITTLDILR
jgi:hypothetical protein